MKTMILPTELNEKLTDSFDELLSELEHEYDAQGNIKEVHHKNISGFIPFTNGGLELTTMLTLDMCNSSGTFPNNVDVTNELQRVIEYNYTQARHDFIKTNREKLSALYTTEQLDNNSGDINYHDLYEKEQSTLAELLSEFEYEFNTDTFFIQHRAMFYSAENSRNDSGEDEIYFYSGVNTDYEHGRDKGLMDCYVNTVKVSELTTELIDNIFKDMLQST